MLPVERPSIACTSLFRRDCAVCLTSQGYQASDRGLPDWRKASKCATATVAALALSRSLAALLPCSAVQGRLHASTVLSLLPKITCLGRHKGQQQTRRDHTDECKRTTRAGPHVGAKPGHGLSGAWQRCESQPATQVTPAQIQCIQPEFCSESAQVGLVCRASAATTSAGLCCAHVAEKRFGRLATMPGAGITGNPSEGPKAAAAVHTLASAAAGTYPSGELCFQKLL